VAAAGALRKRVRGGNGRGEAQGWSWHIFIGPELREEASRGRSTVADGSGS
jgi:hypothetical protein